MALMTFCFLLPIGAGTDCPSLELLLKLAQAGGVEIIRAAPLGDPVELRLRGYTLTLRRADGAQVTVEPGRQLRREEGRDWIW